MPEMQDIGAVICQYSGLSRKVFEYSQEMKRVVDLAGAGKFKPSDWDGIESFIDTAKFVRVGNFKEVMNWAEYRGFLTAWVTTSGWECSFKRVTEAGNLVFLELEERSTVEGHQSAVNSVSVYLFGTTGLLEHLDIYLQMPMPDPAMLAGYAGIEIKG